MPRCGASFLSLIDDRIKDASNGHSPCYLCDERSGVEEFVAKPLVLVMYASHLHNRDFPHRGDISDNVTHEGEG